MMSDQFQTIAQARLWALEELVDQADSNADVQALLCDVLQCQPVALLTWPDQVLSQQQTQCFIDYISQRRQGRPVAYITGSRGFWDLELAVSPHTLIPRPETELLVELALDLPLSEEAKALDLGTGTGAIALAIGREKPRWAVTGVDYKPEIIGLAEQNRRANAVTNVSFIVSSWFEQLRDASFDLIVSNPPYVEDNSPWLQQGDVRFEPLSALTSGADGLDDIRHIITASTSFLTTEGWLVFEHGFEQGYAIRELLGLHGFTQLKTCHDLAGLDRVTLGQWPG